MVMGIDPQRDKAVRDYDVVAGTFFDQPGVLLEASRPPPSITRWATRSRSWAASARTAGPSSCPSWRFLSAKRGGLQPRRGDLPALGRGPEDLPRRRGKINALSVVLSRGPTRPRSVPRWPRMLAAGDIESPASGTQVYSKTMQDLEKGLNAVMCS